MVINARGNAYAPGPAPQSGGEQELRQWNVREYGRIASALNAGRAEFLSLDVLQEAPSKPFPGMVCFFAAGVVAASEGCYEYRSSGTWNKL